MQELSETELRLRNGGLGGVDDFDVWNTKLTTSETVSSLVSHLFQKFPVSFNNFDNLVKIFFLPCRDKIHMLYNMLGVCMRDVLFSYALKGSSLYQNCSVTILYVTSTALEIFYYKSTEHLLSSKQMW